MKRSFLTRTKGLRRTRRRKHDPEARERFNRAVLGVIDTPTGPRVTARCVMCGNLAQDAHHVTPKQRLYEVARSLNFTEAETADLVFDPRNGIPLDRACHDAHEGASCRVLRAALPEAAMTFVAYVDALTGTQAARQRLVLEYPDNAPVGRREDSRG